MLNGGLEDPLDTYERIFAGLNDSITAFHREGSAVAFRFPDPDGRRDEARRIIPHEFIVLDDPSATIDSVETAERAVWPLVSDIYSRIWGAETPPSRVNVELDE